MKTKVLVFLAGLTFLMAPSVWAHEHRTVANQFMLMVGFVKEPAFAGEMNGVDLHIMTLDGEKPIEGADQNLHVTVYKDGKSVTLPFRPKYKEPGRYAGYFLPTQPGTYVFVIEGSINNTAIKEKFESGKGKFNDVEKAVVFP